MSGTQHRMRSTPDCSSSAAAGNTVTDSERPTEPAREAPPRKVGRKYLRISRGFWSEDTRRSAWFLTLGMLAFLLANLIAALGVNRWNRFFFDAIEKKQVGLVLVGVGIILILAVGSAAASVGLVQVRMRLALRWRQWITRKLIARWLGERPFYQLTRRRLHHTINQLAFGWAMLELTCRGRVHPSTPAP